MNVWTTFILGLLVGWIVEWVIDWIYWRQRMQGSTAELESLRAQNSRLRADIEAGAGTMNKLKADLVAATSGMAAAKADNDRMRAEIDAGAGSLGQLKADLATANTNLSTAQAERDRLRIELEARRADHAPMQAELGVARDSKAQLLSTDPELAAWADTGVHLTDSGGRSETAEIARLHDELAAPRSITTTHERDPLIDINGIGPAYEQRLFEAGIYTFDDLAAQTPDHLRELVGAKAWQEADAEAWIAEARQMAQRHERKQAIGQPHHDPLIDINGIGPVYEQRLFEAGIYTFDDLATQTPDHLRELVGAKAWQEADAEAWIAEARQMAQAAKGRSAP